MDSLRAGHVAILDGAFRYFCDATCKSAYVEAVSKRPALDAMTAEPPPVASAERSTATASSSHAAATTALASGVRDTPTEAAAHVESSSSDPVAVEPFFPSLGHDQEEEEQEHDQAGEPRWVEEHDAPSTLRSPAVSEGAIDHAVTTEEKKENEAPPSASLARSTADEARPEESKLVGHLATSTPIVGVLAGVLSAVVSIAGEPASSLRLPLALAAAAIILARMAFAPRNVPAAEPSIWVVGLPIGVGAGLAVVSTSIHHPHADAHASFVGLAAAAALTVDILLSRAMRDVLDARARTETMLGATSVKPGEQVLVEAGETVPVDGVVAAGEAEVAPWLDSPVLLQKTEGEAVVAGAQVVTGRIRINATFSGGERAWLRLAQPTASRIEVAAPLIAFVRRMVERGAPASALVVAAAVYADNGSWLDVAVAACGGGYALAAFSAVAAAALAHARGHVRAQTRGIVYKDAAAFDAAARADVAVMCSRGTILLGEPEIVAVETITKDGVSPNGWLRSPSSSSIIESSAHNDIARVLAIAAGAEMSSTHPFASAILREARARNIRPDNVRSALGHSGLGVTALAPNGDRVIVGSRAFLLQEKVSVAIADARTSELEAQGRSVLLVAVGGRLVGLLALQDGMRPGARAAVQRLHDARIEPVLLSGEARDTSETIARALDIEHVRPEILPVDRGAEVRALADGGRIVAAMGHATTDDGALGAADVSIAMEAAGAAPGEWAVALASDDVRDAALALTIPRGCRDRAKTAVVVGGLTQALGALGIAFGIAPPAVVPVLGVLAATAVVSIVRAQEQNANASS